MNTLGRILLTGAMVIMATVGVRAETTVIARPVIDGNGMVSYQVNKVLRMDGNWKNLKQEDLLYPGMLLYPEKPIAIKGMEGRLGEAVIIVFPQAGNPGAWRGYHVFNGFVPAFGGRPAAELIGEIERMPAGTPTPNRALPGMNLQPVDIRTLIELWKKAARQQVSSVTPPPAPVKVQ